MLISVLETDDEKVKATGGRGPVLHWSQQGTSLSSELEGDQSDFGIRRGPVSHQNQEGISHYLNQEGTSLSVESGGDQSVKGIRKGPVYRQNRQGIEFVVGIRRRPVCRKIGKGSNGGRNQQGTSLSLETGGDQAVVGNRR